jgi:hypothetical protein
MDRRLERGVSIWSEAAGPGAALCGRRGTTTQRRSHAPSTTTGCSDVPRGPSCRGPPHEQTAPTLWTHHTTDARPAQHAYTRPLRKVTRRGVDDLAQVLTCPPALAAFSCLIEWRAIPRRRPHVPDSAHMCVIASHAVAICVQPAPPGCLSWLQDVGCHHVHHSAVPCSLASWTLLFSARTLPNRILSHVTSWATARSKGWRACIRAYCSITAATSPDAPFTVCAYATASLSPSLPGLSSALTCATSEPHSSPTLLESRDLPKHLPYKRRAQRLLYTSLHST